MKKKKKISFSTILLMVILIAGLSLLLYPSFSDYWNSFHQTKAIADYSETIKNMNAAEYARILQEARDYNDSLLKRKNAFLLSEEQAQRYKALLNVDKNGVMGYIEIPAIGCTLPIYHGTAESVLQIGIGHLDWTSLPVGGEGSHCVLSGHRGLPTARLFTDLDKLNKGDVFMLRVMDEILTYEVDQVLIVKPNETDALLIEDNQDYCTLVTCTPYGINTHRLLVRGRRIDNIQEAKAVRVTADAIMVEPLIVAPIVATPILLLLLIYLMIPNPSKNKHGGADDEDE